MSPGVFMMFWSVEERGRNNNVVILRSVLAWEKFTLMIHGNMSYYVNES
jgi:hypothetical protein